MIFICLGHWATSQEDCMWKMITKFQWPALGISLARSRILMSPSKVLGAVIQCLPVHELNKAILLLLTNKSITDEKLTEAIDNMVGWLHWPLIERIDDWIIVCLKGLAALNRFSILMDIGEKTIKNVSDTSKKFKLYSWSVLVFWIVMSLV